MKHALCLVKSLSKTDLKQKLTQAKIDLLSQKTQYPTHIDNQTLKTPHYVFTFAQSLIQLSSPIGNLIMNNQSSSQTNKPITGLFTGQGAQFFNMGKSHYEHLPVFKQQMDLCLRYLSPY